ncbi:hypothetical protein AAHA92_14067 [Salvia divinorum]|uniref:Uncharacterized protein n=1 Tax=Salvia divinorum TaxID=28513 RepID=A0ABD1HAB8_SALDI
MALVRMMPVVQRAIGGELKVMALGILKAMITHKRAWRRLHLYPKKSAKKIKMTHSSFNFCNRSYAFESFFSNG